MLSALHCDTNGACECVGHIDDTDGLATYRTQNNERRETDRISPQCSGNSSFNCK